MDVKSMSLQELTEAIEGLGQPKFRAKQIYTWMHRDGVSSYEEMLNLPKTLRHQLSEQYPLTVLRTVTVQQSAIDGTRKYLFALPDGNLIESVLMKYRHGNSVCISSQVGCKMGCRFCASTLDGWVRNLSPSEMLDQVYRIQKDLGERITHVVVMGTGEPLDNYEALCRFIRMLTDENGLHISQRNLTVSTCGLAPEIRRFADEGFVVTLALSLHTSSQEKRCSLMPVADIYDLDQVLSACDEYFQKTGRRISYEYSLVGGVNDTKADAEELCALLRGRPAHVNLISVNPIRERNYRSSGQKVIKEFQNKLEKSGINVTIRREMGRDIDGACGQLRRRHLQDPTDAQG